MVTQKSSGLPWFTLAYPLEGSFQWWERPCSPCSPCAETPETASAAWRCAAVSVGEDRMTMARGHSCRSRFEEFPAAIANWCSSMKFNPASYDIFIDVLFCQVQQVEWISELQIGAPDFNGCYMSRSPLQSFLEVQESWFQVRPCHDQRSTFYWNILFWSSSISLTSAEGTLLGHPWANVKNERNVSTHWIITCQIQQCEYWSILCIEGCQFGCQQCSGNAPVAVDMVREERQTELVNLLMDRRLLAARVGLKHCSGPRMSTSTDITWWNFWRLWGWKPFSSGVR